MDMLNEIRLELGRIADALETIAVEIKSGRLDAISPRRPE